MNWRRSFWWDVLGEPAAHKAYLQIGIGIFCGLGFGFMVEAYPRSMGGWAFKLNALVLSISYFQGSKKP